MMKYNFLLYQKWTSICTNCTSYLMGCQVWSKFFSFYERISFPVITIEWKAAIEILFVKMMISNRFNYLKTFRSISFYRLQIDRIRNKISACEAQLILLFIWERKKQTGDKNTFFSLISKRQHKRKKKIKLDYWWWYKMSLIWLF
jgi:hypothetical protein